jgi:S-disulfanyl-L-cysteine oxidoreductase SoxD
MSRFREPLVLGVIAVIAIAATTVAAHAQGTDAYAGIGRNATPAEVKAWNIDVRPDFQGLPKGSGSVSKGQAVWEGKCASCHGVFGESNEVFQPLIGGTTAEDIKTGHVAALKRNDVERTMIMKLPTVSTLWDYINRAMPWTAPKSLSTEEVYAVTAYLLNMGGVLPDDYVLSDRNIAEVQARLPNRNGMTTQHAMWPGKELGGAAKPDVHNVACMKNCPVEAKVTSSLPEHARNAHGNLAEQVRLVGPARGDDTSAPEPAHLGDRPKAGADQAQAPAKTVTAAAAPAAPTDLLQKNGCVACHSVSSKLVGPAFIDVAKKHAGQADYLAGKIRSGGSGVWGNIPMPPQSIAPEDAAKIAGWLASGAAQ